jgi:GDPmannose 4,6-dehydratase
MFKGKGISFSIFFLVSLELTGLWYCSTLVAETKEYTRDSGKEGKGKKAIIWGINGQDGPYLTEFLLAKGYEVHGVVRNLLEHSRKLEQYLRFIKRTVSKNLILHQGDITDEKGVFSVIKEVQPDEIYNLAAQSSVAVSFKEFKETSLINCMGCIYILDAIHRLELHKKTKFFHAGSGEIFGKIEKAPHNENSVPKPSSPYAVTKLFAYEMIKLCRQTHNIFACYGILFNHESPLRSEQFITKIVSKAVAEIHLGLRDSFSVGNINAVRDWGYAKDYVEAMWLILQQDKPDDFVIATGKIHSVRELIEEAFKQINIKLTWKGEGVDEVGYDKKNGKKLVFVNAQYFRPLDPAVTLGDARKAYAKLKWEPKTTFAEMVNIMVAKDIELLRKQHTFN